MLNKAASEYKPLTDLLGGRIRCLTQIQDFRFDRQKAVSDIDSQFSIKSPDELGLAGEDEAVLAIGALLSYVYETQKADLSHINKLDFFSNGRYMELDAQTIRNLELLSSLRSQEKRGSLLWAMDSTKTPMGLSLIHI